MLRDRVSSFWALRSLALGGSNPPEPLFVPAPAWRHVPRGTVGPGACSCSSWDTVTTNPQPLPYSLYEGDVYVAPGLPMAIDVAEAN